MSEIEKKLKREMDAKAPDLKEKIMAEAFPESAVRQPRGKSAPFALRRAIYSVCIVVALAAIIITAALLTPPPGGTTVVVSINPRVEFVLDDDTIVSQKGLNEAFGTRQISWLFKGQPHGQACGKLQQRQKSGKGVSGVVRAHHGFPFSKSQRSFSRPSYRGRIGGHNRQLRRKGA